MDAPTNERDWRALRADLEKLQRRVYGLREWHHVSAELAHCLASFSNQSRSDELTRFAI